MEAMAVARANTHGPLDKYTWCFCHRSFVISLMACGRDDRETENYKRKPFGFSYFCFYNLGQSFRNISVEFDLAAVC